MMLRGGGACGALYQWPRLGTWRTHPHHWTAGVRNRWGKLAGQAIAIRLVLA